MRYRYCHAPLIISYDTRLPIPTKVDGEVTRRAKTTDIDVLREVLMKDLRKPPRR